MRSSPLFPGVVVGALLISATADDPLTDGGGQGRQGSEESAQVLAEKEVGWLGVGVTEVNPVVSDQLGLPEHIGLAVEVIVPDGPAEKAGLKRHDVLTKLDDQLLVLQQQLEILVWNRAAGDQVVLTLLRKGQEHTVTATLGGRRVPAVRQPNQEELLSRMLLRDFPQMQKYLDEKGTLRGIRHSVIDMAEREVTLKSEDCSICFDRHEGEPYVRVRDSNGALVYEGPLEDQEELDKLPKAIRERVDALIHLLEGNPMLALPWEKQDSAEAKPER